MTTNKNWTPTLTIPLEQVYQPKNALEPLLILDFRVYVWRLVQKYQEFCTSLIRDQKVVENFLKAQFALFYHDLIPELHSEYRLIICNDQKSESYAYDGNAGDKNYWRNSVLFREGFPEYKGSRGGDKSKPEFYHHVYNTGINYAKELDIPILESEGFEADDFIAALVRDKKLKGYDRDYIICSIDSDLMQLVDDSEGILWYSCNSFGHTSKLRSEVEVHEYCSKMFGKSVVSPREIVDIKVEKGDSSDCLEPGSPRMVIDLINPYIVPNNYPEDLIEAINNDNYKSNISSEILEKAKKYLENFPRY